MTAKIKPRKLLKNELSDEQWQAQGIPIYWVKLPKAEFEALTGGISQVIRVWLSNNTKSWWWVDRAAGYYFFGDNEDCSSFLYMWRLGAMKKLLGEYTETTP